LRAQKETGQEILSEIERLLPELRGRLSAESFTQCQSQAQSQTLESIVMEALAD